MAFLDRIKDKAGEVASKAADVAEIAGDAGSMAMDKVTGLLDEYQKALGVLGKFGFTVGKFDIEMSLLPKIRTSVHGSMDALDIGGLKQMITDHEGDSLTVAMLKALITAKELAARIDLKKRTIVLDVTLGIPPGIAAHLGD